MKFPLALVALAASAPCSATSFLIATTPVEIQDGSLEIFNDVPGSTITVTGFDYTVDVDGYFYSAWYGGGEVAVTAGSGQVSGSLFANSPPYVPAIFRIAFSTTPLGQFPAFRSFTISNIEGDSPGQVSFMALGAVPEPATWAMMFVGFGLIGCSLRRRNKVAAAA